VGRIAIFLLLICLIVILYISIRNYVVMKRRAWAEKETVSKPESPLESLIQQYHNADPELQEWMALNAATALGMTVDQFIIATKKPPRPIIGSEAVNCILIDHDGVQTKEVLYIPSSELGSAEGLKKAVLSKYPYKEFASASYDFYKRPSR
jgi:hypothetical protein